MNLHILKFKCNNTKVLSTSLTVSGVCCFLFLIIFIYFKKKNQKKLKLQMLNTELLNKDFFNNQLLRNNLKKLEKSLKPGSNQLKTINEQDEWEKGREGREVKEINFNTSIHINSHTLQIN